MVDRDDEILIEVTPIPNSEVTDRDALLAKSLVLAMARLIQTTEARDDGTRYSDHDAIDLAIERSRPLLPSFSIARTH